MNKKILSALIAFTLLVPVSAKAAGLKNQSVLTPTVAILDTGIDMTLPIFKDRVVQEVCILDWSTCPNGSSFMEGPGSATLTPKVLSVAGWEHGTQMASIFLKSNPNANIIFIKVIGNTPDGLRQSSFESTVFNALNWVAANNLKYNIKAVTMSQGHHNLGPVGTNYCPTSSTTVNSIKNLISLGIPTFFPAGNGRDYSRIDWPSCLDDSISVGVTDKQGDISTISNSDPSKIDFFALGAFDGITSAGGVLKNVLGSSASTQVAAAQWMILQSANPTSSYSTLFKLLADSAVTTTGRQGTFNKLINLSLVPIAVPAPGPTAAELAAQKAAADAAVKLALKIEVDKAIAAAQLEYDTVVKAAADKLSAYKISQLARLNA